MSDVPTPETFEQAHVERERLGAQAARHAGTAPPGWAGPGPRDYIPGGASFLTGDGGGAGSGDFVDAFDVERPASMTLLRPDRGARREAREARETRGSRWPDAGAASSGGGSAEFEDLATVRRFAEQICALGDGSDYTQTIAACAALRDWIRDFGGDMNRSVTAFVDAATAVARSGQELTAQAVRVAGLASDMSGA